MSAHFDWARDAVIYVCSQCGGEVITEVNGVVIGLDLALHRYCHERDRVLAELEEKLEAGR